MMSRALTWAQRCARPAAPAPFAGAPAAAGCARTAPASGVAETVVEGAGRFAPLAAGFAAGLRGLLTLVFGFAGRLAGMGEPPPWKDGSAATVAQRTAAESSAAASAASRRGPALYGNRARW